MVRVVSSSGYVTTIAGSENYGASDGLSTFALFNGPVAVAVDAIGGRLMITDANNHAIRSFSWASGQVSTFAGTIGISGDAGNFFYSPTGLCFDLERYLYIADTYNGVVKKVSSNGENMTIIGEVPCSYDVVVDSRGLVYSTSSCTHSIRVIDQRTSITTIIAGTVDTLGFTQGLGTYAQFNSPAGVKMDTDGNLIVTDASAVHKINVTTLNVITIAGSTLGVTGSANGLGTFATFDSP